MAVTGESLGRLFVELGLADDQFLTGIKSALSEVQTFRSGVVKAGKEAAEGMKPLIAVTQAATAAERAAAEQINKRVTTEQERAKALGVSVAQLREMDRELEKNAAAEKAAADAAAKETAALQAQADAAAKAAAKVAAADALKAEASAAAATKAAASEAAALEQQAAARAAGAAQMAAQSEQAAAKAKADQAAFLVAMGAATYGLAEFGKGAVTAAAQYQSAFAGLRTVATAFGRDANAAQKAAEDLASDGLISAGDAAKAFKNALSSGYSIDEATTLLKALKDQAVYNRQAQYDLGGAVVATTEGIKNQNSVLADATGTTKNLSVMSKEYAEKIGTTVGKLTDAQKRQAAYNGFLEDASRSAGDAAEASDTLAGSIARSDVAAKKAQVSLGEALTPAYRALLTVVTGTTEAVGSFADALPGTTAGVGTAALTFTGLATAITAAKLASDLFKASLGPIGVALAAVSLAVGAATAAYTAYTDASTEAAAKEKAHADAIAQGGVNGALQEQIDLQNELTEATKRLGYAQADQGKYYTSKTGKRGQEAIDEAQAEVDAIQARLDAQKDAVKTERDLAATRERTLAQEAKDAAAQAALDKVTEKNLTAVQKLRKEEAEELSKNAGASAEILQGIQEQYGKLIDAELAKEGKKAKTGADKVKAEVERAAAALDALKAIAEDARAEVDAAMNGDDAGLQALDTKLRTLADKLQDALKAAGKIANSELRAQAVDAANAAAEAARTATIEAYTVTGEKAAKAEAQAYYDTNVKARAATVDKINAIELAALDEGDQARREKWKALNGFIFTSEAERAEVVAFYDQKIAAADEALAKKRKADAKEVRDAYLDTASTILSSLESVSGDLASRHSDNMAAIEAELQSAEDGEISLTRQEKAQLQARYELQKQAYLRAFYVQKAASIASAVISTAQAVMSTYAALAAAPPVAIAAAAAVAALGAVQIGIIASEQPSFDVGGEITEAHRRASPGTAPGRSVAANVHVGEGILTAGKGMAAIGGSSGLALANAGVPLVPLSVIRGGRVSGGDAPPPFLPNPAGRGGGQGSSRPVVINSMVDGKVVDRTLVRAWDDGRSEVQRKVYRAAGVRVGMDRG